MAQPPTTTAERRVPHTSFILPPPDPEGPTLAAHRKLAATTRDAP